MILQIDDLVYGECTFCIPPYRQPLPRKLGFVVEDANRLRYFLCMYHTMIWLKNTLRPLVEKYHDA